MTRLTDVDICIEKIKQLPITYDAETVQRCIEVLSNAPNVDAEPVHHGKWMGTVCSVCGESIANYYDCDYCPNCGARMEQE